MGTETEKRISAAREKGYTNEQIADAFRKKLTAANIEPERINEFLANHGLVGTISEYSFLDQVSNKMRGFGRDVMSGLGSGLTLAKKGTGPLGQALSLPAAYAFGSAGQNVEDLARGGSRKHGARRYRDITKRA